VTDMPGVSFTRRSPAFMWPFLTPKPAGRDQILS
jgi:hypothetical protein